MTLLTLFEVAENETGDEFWSTVAGLPRFDSLDLIGEGVADASIGRMPAMAKLRVLRLSKGRTKLSGETLAAAVTRLPALEELSVTYKALSDADAKQLESLTPLTKLTLMATEITAAGVARLHEALPNCLIESDHGTFGPTKTE